MIELSFPDSNEIEINEDMYQIVTSMLDLPSMKYLKSLKLDFPVLFPVEKLHYEKQIQFKIYEQLFVKAAYLNNIKIFGKISSKIERLVNLKSFNFERIWI